MQVQINRSSEWTKARRVATGKNVEDSVFVDVDPATLSETVRAAIITMKDAYPQHLYTLYYSDKTGEPAGEHPYSTIAFYADIDEPTPADVDAAILRAMARAKEKVAESKAKEAARALEKEAERQKAEEHKQRIAEARELLKADLAKLEKAEAAAKLAAKQRDTLADFIGNFPNDAVNGAIKRIAAVRNKATIEDIRKEIDDASPELVIFGEDLPPVDD